MTKLRWREKFVQAHTVTGIPDGPATGPAYQGRWQRLWGGQDRQ